MKRLLAIAALALASVLPSQTLAANTWGPDLSDLWWNHYESGWGANIAHQGDTIFLTLFVYGQDMKPKWFVGPALKSQGNFEPYMFTGDLFETSGPWINGLFDPSDVTRRRVGYATIVYPDSGQLRLSYTVDNISNTKWLERQTFREADLTGTYIGATAGTASGCSAGSSNVATASEFTIVHQLGSTVVIRSFVGGAPACTYSGTYSQHGRMGLLDGVVSCTNGQSGSFLAEEFEASYQGFVTSYSADFGAGCTHKGRMGGVKR